MNDDQLLRHSRHILLDDIGIEGLERIVAAHVLIVGAGGLGSPAALYLGAAGVGTLTLLDDDVVDLTNLQRQIVHATQRIGQSKAISAQQAIHALNPHVDIRPLVQRATADTLAPLVAAADVVLDCTDNYATRQAINAACVCSATPLVSGAAIRFTGQIMVYDPRQANAPCYACLFPPDAAFTDMPCAVMGVFAPLVGIIGSMQAAEALKLLAATGTSLAGRLLLLEGKSMQWTTMQTQRDTCCSVCGTG